MALGGILLLIWEVGVVEIVSPTARETSKAQSPTKQRAFFHPLLPVGNQESVLKVPKGGQFHAAIRVTTRRCDLCAQGALGRRTASQRNFCDAESRAKRYVKVARLQSDFCTKDFFRATDFLTKNAPKFSQKFLSLCSVGQKKSPENCLQISH